jgi:type I site-specific restriction-modification system R (restriction) subunit
MKRIKIIGQDKMNHTEEEELKNQWFKAILNQKIDEIKEIASNPNFNKNTTMIYLNLGECLKNKNSKNKTRYSTSHLCSQIF